MSSDISAASPGDSESHRKERVLTLSSHVIYPRGPSNGKARVYEGPSPGGIRVRSIRVTVISHLHTQAGRLRACGL